MLPDCGGAAGLKTPSGGKVVKIATTGSDSNNGVQAPVATLDAAVKLTRPGDVIEYEAGTYSGGFAQDLHGTAQAPITIRAAAGAKVILSSTSDGGSLALLKSSYVIVEGFEITNSGGVGLSLLDCSYITARNLNIHDVYKGAIFAVTHDSVIEKSTIHNCVMRNSHRGNSWDSCVQTGRHSDGSSSRNVTFRELVIHDAFGEGINQWYSDGGRTIGNVIYDTWSAPIYNDHATNIRVENNYVYISSDAWKNPVFGNNRATGIQIATEPPAGNSSHFVIANNVVVGTGWGIAYWNAGSSAYEDLVIAHNVVANTTLEPLHIDVAQATAGCLLTNNLFFASGVAPVLGNPEAWTVSHNNWVGARPDFDKNPSSLSVEPLLAGSTGAGQPATNYAPRAGSPLLSAGTPMTAVPYDFYCKPRSQIAPSIGAFETP